MLGHRGPDGTGLRRVAVGRHSVHLGHTRLAIVDLSDAAAQPMETDDGSHTLVYNGEVYNHAELREGLRTAAFRGHSDTETVLRAVAERGIGAVAGFDGFFALAVVDRPGAKLYLARDPFGVKPLYYALSGGRIAFASELRALLRLRPSEIDPEALATLLRFGYLPSPDTLFQGVRKLRPGHVLEVDLGAAEPSACERPVLFGRSDLTVRDFSEAVREYGRLLEAAVRSQLMGDVEIGVLLSGGVDSAVIAALARRETDRPMKAFTVGYIDADASDETAEAAATARWLGLEAFETRMGFDDFRAALRSAVAIVEEPVATTSIVPMHFLTRLAGEHVKVVLTGQGADETLGGYARYRLELLAGTIPAPACRAAGWLASRPLVTSARLGRAARILRSGDFVSRFVAQHEVFGEECIQRLIGRSESRARDRARYCDDLLDLPDETPSAGRLMSMDLRMSLADDFLLYTDKLGMRSSLECRVPYLDHDLVRFVESLPCRYRVGLFRSKILHRRFARGLLPRSIVARRKRGFLSPTRAWFSKPGALDDLLRDDCSPFSSWFDAAEVHRLATEHRQGRNRERQLFLLLATHYWLDVFQGAKHA
jgi:asparagine synthase (glutamine-hydrolysing)